jgi:F-type H+-transporting ATPase subunit a
MFPITNSIIATWVVMLILIIIGFIVSGSIKQIPSTIQNIFEYAIESLLGLMDSVTQDRIKTERFFPWVVTFFFFILFSNWIELIPGFSAIGIKTVEDGKTAIIPFLRSANTDLNTTLALAIISVIMIQIFGIISLGFTKYAKKFINFSSVIGFFLGLLEILSEIARIISFSFRLFGNIFAGEVLLVVITFLIPYLLPIPFYGMELFVGFIQALVFAMLTLVFMTVATTSHEEAH